MPTPLRSPLKLWLVVACLAVAGTAATETHAGWHHRYRCCSACGSASCGSAGGSAGGHASCGGHHRGWRAAHHGSCGSSGGAPAGSGGGSTGGAPAAAAPAAKPKLANVPADGALLVVEVPENARVLVNGTPTTATGTVRHFVSSGLAADKTYDYVVTMSIDRDGKAEEQTRTVSLGIGDEQTVSFTSADATEMAHNAELVLPTRTTLTLRVPADAKVWIEGTEIPSTGSVRHFHTTQLRPGQTWDRYEVRVESLVDGKPHSIAKQLSLIGGKEIDVAIDPVAPAIDTLAIASGE